MPPLNAVWIQLLSSFVVPPRPTSSTVRAVYPPFVSDWKPDWCERQWLNDYRTLYCRGSKLNDYRTLYCRGSKLNDYRTLYCRGSGRGSGGTRRTGSSAPFSTTTAPDFWTSISYSHSQQRSHLQPFRTVLS